MDYVNQQDQHSIVGYGYLFGQGIVRWSSKKQQIITLPTVEAKYVAHVHAVKERLWLWMFLRELQNQTECQITINSNNQGVIMLLKDNK